MLSDSSKTGPHKSRVVAKPAASKKHPYGPFSAIFMSLAAYFGSYLLFFVSIGAILFAVSTFQGVTLESLATKFDESTTGKFAASLLVYTFMVLIIYGFMRKVGAGLSYVGLGRRPNLNDMAWALPICIIYFIVLSVTMALISKFAPGIDLNQEQQLSFDKSTHGFGLALVFVGLVIVPPLVEEFVMRGFLFSGLRSKLSLWPAALLTSLIFAVAHLQIGAGAPPLYVAAIDTFILSMFLVYLRVKTGGIWAGMLVHALKNGIAFSALFLIK